MQVVIFLFCCLWVVFPASAQSIVGEWEYVSVPHQKADTLQEVQTTLRCFSADGSFSESILYAEHIVTVEGEKCAVSFRSSIGGQWRWQGEHLLLDYRPRSLSVSYEGMVFPERDKAVQGLLREAAEDSLRVAIPQQLARMKKELYRYYKAYPKRYLQQVEVTSDRLFVTTREGRRAYRRVGAQEK